MAKLGTTKEKTVNSGRDVTLLSQLKQEVTFYQEKLQAQSQILTQSRRMILQEVTKSYNDLYDFAPLGYLAMDRQGRIRQINSTCAGIFGLPKNSLVGATFFSLISDPDTDCFRHALEKCISDKETSNLELCIVAKDQRQLYLDVSMRPDSSWLCRCAITDITERKRGEEALKKAKSELEEEIEERTAELRESKEKCSEEQFRAMFEQSPLGIAVIDPSTYTLLKTNDQFCKILGYEEGELFDLNVSIITHPDDIVMSLAHLRLITERKFPKYQIEKRYIRRDGSIIWANLTCVRLNNLGSDDLMLALLEDVTEKKRIKQDLVDSLDQLSRLSAELNLSEERERHRIASQLHDHVVQDLALCKLKLCTLLKTHDLSQIAVAELAEELEKILEASIKQIRDLSFELSPPVLYEVGLNAAIRSLGQRYSTEYGFRFRFRGVPEELCLREELKIALFQMTRELLINVIKHANASIVTVLLRKRKTHLLLQVSDNGQGFEPRTLSDGFGLANIRQRVSYMGGVLKIESEPGLGTDVKITVGS